MTYLQHFTIQTFHKFFSFLLQIRGQLVWNRRMVKRLISEGYCVRASVQEIGQLVQLPAKGVYAGYY
jgi:hypothetical protein